MRPMKQTRQIKMHVLYSVQCYHCHTSHYNNGSIMMWPTKQAAINAALEDGWDIYLLTVKRATNDEDIRKAIDNYIFCTRSIVVGRHFAQIKSIHSAKNK